MLNFLRNLFSRPSSDQHEEPTFSTLDTDAIIKNFDIANKGKEAGDANMPAPDQTSFDATESKIALLISEDLGETSRKVNNKLVAYNTSIAKINLRGDFERLRNLPVNVGHKVESMLEEYRAQLVSLDQQRNHLREELATFRKINQLRRTANYPETKLLPLAIVVTLLLFESVLNGYFFATGSEFGLLGGVFQAFIIALVNVIGAFLAGYMLFPWRNHTGTLRRVTGWILHPVMIGVAIIFNLIIAHYRDQLAIDPFNTTLMAFDQFAELAFTLSGFDSWLLFGVGLLFSLFAMFEGYRCDDPYPDYGPLSRRVKLAEEDYDAAKSNLIAEFQALKQESTHDLEFLNSQVKSDLNTLHMLIESKRNLLTNFQHYQQHLQDCCNTLLRTYRDANRTARSTPAPDYFKQSFQFSELPVISQTNEDSEKLSQERNYANELIDITESAKTRLTTVYTESFSAIKRLDVSIQESNPNESKHPNTQAGDRV